MNKPPHPEDFKTIGPGAGGKRKGGRSRKGRQVDPAACRPFRPAQGRELRRDHLIEYLHLIQDEYGHIAAPHLPPSPFTCGFLCGGVRGRDVLSPLRRDKEGDPTPPT